MYNEQMMRALALMLLFSSMALAADDPVFNPEVKKALEQLKAKPQHYQFFEKVASSLSQLLKGIKGMESDEESAQLIEDTTIEGRKALVVAMEYSSRANANLLSENAEECLGKFNPLAIKNAVTYLATAKAAKTPTAIVERMIKGRIDQTGDDRDDATREVCRFATDPCPLFGSPILATCKQLERKPATAAKTDADAKLPKTVSPQPQKPGAAAAPAAKPSGGRPAK